MRFALLSLLLGCGPGFHDDFAAARTNCESRGLNWRLVTSVTDENSRDLYSASHDIRNWSCMRVDSILPADPTPRP